MENNLEQLKKLAKIFNSDKVITTEEIQQVLKGIIQIMNTFKKGNEQLNAETKQVVEILFNKILVEHEKIVSQVTDTTENTKKELNNKLSKTVDEIKSLMEEVKAMKPLDGKDADEEKIVQDVLSQIKLPEYKETVLDDGEEIVAKINDLPTDSTAPKIDASHIKNLPKMVKNYIGGSAGNIKEIVAGSGVTVDNSVPGYPTISASISTGSSDTQVLFNKLGVITGNADMVFDYTNKTLKVGGGTPTYTLDSALAFISTRSVDGYYSTSIQNLSTDTSASTDIILNNDAATDDINYLDIGIASSTNTDPLYTIAGAGQAYIYNQSESLAIGTATSGKVIKFHTGGTLAENEGARLDGGLFSVGLNATTLGQLKLYGNTSGSVTLQPNAVAGTNIVLTLPATTGTVALTSNILDEKVKYDAGDPTAGYVADKIIAGTGISVAEGTGGDENKLKITNSAPDQTVSITGAGISVVTGTYPNFTITSTETVTQYTDEMAQDAVGNAVGNGLDYDDATGTISVDETELTHNSLGGKQGGTTGEYYHLTSAQATVVANTSGTNTGDQDLSGLVTKATYDANSILYATTDDTPVALTVGEQTVVGRATGGAISALAIDSDLTSVSANDDTIPSAKATKTALDLKAPIANPTFTGVVTIPNVGLHLLDTNASHDLIIAPGSDLTADKTLTITTGDADTNLNLTAVTDGYVLTYDTGTNSWRGEAGGAGSGATTALDNLASVAINTTLVSDTDNTDALGTVTKSWSDLFLGSGGVITWTSAPDTADVTLTHSANTLTLAGGDLALGANNLTLTGSIASTGSRVTKGWFTDLEVTNAIAGSITGSAVYWKTSGTGKAEITGPASGQTRTFTFPDADATMMTLASTDTITGAKTFNNTVVLGEVSMQLDPSISADGKWSGITETGTAGAALTFGQLCYYNSSNKWVLAKADSSTTSTNKLGICVLAAAGDTSATEVLLYGKVNAAAQFPTLTVGAPVYISAATGGAIVTAQPSATDNVIRIIGYGNTGDELFFCPDNTWITHT